MLNLSENSIRWMTVRQATRYCPYGYKKLIGLIQEGVIQGGQLSDNKDAWFLDRLSLDSHIESHCKKPKRVNSKEVQNNIVDFVRRMT